MFLKAAVRHVSRADTIMEKDGRTDGPTDGRTRQSESIIAPTFCGGVLKKGIEDMK